MEAKGILCISLDFEKYWGVHDIFDWKLKENEMLKVNEVVEETLQLFEKYNIHASWATVGLLAVGEEQQLNSFAKISYENENYSPFPFSRKKFDKIPLECRSAIDQIKLISNSKNQEIASHTFAHLYTIENGISKNDFKDDLARMKAIEDQFNISFNSLVFPRNQISKDYLKLAKKDNYSSFRGNQRNKFWRNSEFKNESIIKRGFRWFDAYFDVTKTYNFRPSELLIEEGLKNIPASRFFRPIGGNKFLEKRKINRIKREMKKATLNGEIYHLWWHPHNFSKNTEQHFVQLEQLLSFYTELNKKGEMISLNMQEIANLND